MFGAAGAIIGVVLHVLERGFGIRISGIGKRFRLRIPVHRTSEFEDKDSSSAAVRLSRYWTALVAFRRPFKRRDRDSEASGNEEKCLKTPEGHCVGERVFFRLRKPKIIYTWKAHPRQTGKITRRQVLPQRSIPARSRGPMPEF